MRYLFLLLISCNSYSMSFGQAQSIYQRLVATNGIGIYPGLYLNPSSDANASSSPMRIEVTAGMLRFAHNADELALVLGHELGHYVLHHTGSTPSNEFAADRLGAQFEDRAGYNHCNGVQLLYRFHDKADSTHPDSDERYARLRCYTEQ